MKKILYILSVATLVIIIHSCKKKDSLNVFSDYKNLGLGSYLTLDKNINLNLDYAHIATSTVGIQVSQYPNGQPIDHINLYATSTGSYDTTQWHFVKSVSYTGPGTQLTVTGTELATALGVSIGSLQPGSVYTFYTRIITKEGYSFDVNTTGDNGGGGLVTGAYYNSVFSFTVYIVCPFTGNMTGTYKVLRDDWEDWSPGDLVQVTDGPGTNQINLSQVYPNPAYGSVINPLIVKIDPASGTATIPPTKFGQYSSAYTAEGAGDNDVAGYVFSCTGYITLNILIGGDPYKLILQKQ
ncbi:MAG: hypothetical protein JST17_04295 [Bacteroidetes bacterium]|nr:hypothetical protein [Bacteroidota bacterium]MBS1929630.1 hypothetical protein [Bacteroidota bacterium]